MKDGFLGYQASFMLDAVVVALVLVVPVLLFSLFSVKFRRQYTVHRNVQMVLAVTLLAAVCAPHPGPHSRLHSLLGWASTLDLVMTSVTGLVFYYVAFVNRG